MQNAIKWLFLEIYSSTNMTMNMQEMKHLHLAQHYEYLYWPQITSSHIVTLKLLLNLHWRYGFTLQSYIPCKHNFIIQTAQHMEFLYILHYPRNNNYNNCQKIWNQDKYNGSCQRPKLNYITAQYINLFPADQAVLEQWHVDNSKTPNIQLASLKQ